MTLDISHVRPGHLVEIAARADPLDVDDFLAQESIPVLCATTSVPNDVDQKDVWK
jgi:hypothetical protein